MNAAMRIAMVGSFAVAPLALSPGLLPSFDVTPKTLIVLTCAAMALAFAGAAWPGLYTAWRNRAGRWFLVCLGAHAVALTGATAFSTNPGVSFAGSRWRELGLPAELSLSVLAIAALGWTWGEPRRRRLLVDAIAVAAVPIGVYAVLQYFGIDPILPEGLYYAGDEEWAVVRPPSTFGHAGYFATWAAGAIFLIWGRAREERGAARAWRVASAALLAAAVVLSGTRGALIGVLAGLVVVAPGLRAMGGRKTLALAGLAVLAAVGFLLSPAGLRLRTRVIWSVQDFQGGARPWLWRDAALMGAGRPLTGHGLETFTAEYSRLRSEDLAVRFPDQTEESPHNIFLDAWVTQGALGTAALLGVCAAPLFGARRRSSAAAAFAATLVANQFLSFTAMTEAMFLLTAALAVAPETAEVEERKPGFMPRIAGAACGVAALAFAARLFFGEAQAERARQALVAGRVPEAVACYRAAEGAAPPGRSYGQWFAGALYASEGFAPEWAATALDALSQGKAESPADAYYLQAALEAQAGSPPERVERALRRSIAASPSWYKPRWKLAQALHALGRPEEAIEWAESARRLAGGVHPEVSRTLDDLRAATLSRESSQSDK